MVMEGSQSPALCQDTPYYCHGGGLRPDLCRACAGMGCPFFPRCLREDMVWDVNKVPWPRQARQRGNAWMYITMWREIHIFISVQYCLCCVWSIY